MSDSTNLQDKSSDELEREVNEERARVSETIDALQDKVSVGNLLDQVMGAVSKHGGDVGKSLGNTVKSNPLPLALTGIGLTWLMMSANKSDSGGDTSSGYGGSASQTGAGVPLSETPMPPETHAEATGRASAVATPGYVAGAATEMPDQSGSGDGKGIGAKAKDAAAKAGDKVSGAAGAARDGIGSAASSARDGASSAADAAGSAASRAGDGVRDAAGSVRDAVGSGASSAGDAMGRAGQAVRSGAEGAGQAAKDAGQKVSDGFDQLMQEQPLVAGALALALGAAIGGSLPRTSRENKLMGEHSDKLKNRGEAIVRDQAQAAQAVAREVKSEAERMVDETAGKADDKTPDGATMVDKAESKVTKAGERLAEAARKEADKQGLGDVSAGKSGSGKS